MKQLGRHTRTPPPHPARRFLLGLTGLCLIATASTPAHANGNHTHIGITLHAITHLPPGPLKQLLSDPAMRKMLIGGTIFPDGGYAVGHGYGEAAHWEPLQRALATRIREVCPQMPGDTGCKQRLAFLLGMASHGMADQTFDGLFMFAAKVHDKKGWSSGTFDSLDSMSDVMWAARHGAADSPELWLPLDDLLAAFAAQGISVEGETLNDGQFLLLNAVLAYVRNAAKDPVKVKAAEARYPWSSSHLDDPHTAGSPFCEGRIVAAYWRSLWAEWVEGRAPTLEVVATVPSHNGAGIAADHTSPDAVAAVVFSRGLDDGSKQPDKVTVQTADGTTLAVKLDIFYGNSAHMLRLTPKQDWPTGQRIDVRVAPGAVRSVDGVDFTQDVVFSFTAGADNATEPGAPPPGWPLADAGSLEADVSTSAQDASTDAAGDPSADTASGPTNGEPDGGCQAGLGHDAGALWPCMFAFFGLLCRRRTAATTSACRIC